MRSEERLGRLLEAWREESTGSPRAAAREAARSALHAALAAPPAPAQRWGFVRLPSQLGLRGLLLTGTAAVVAGAVVVGALGWSAPAGSPLFAVRAARQSVQLILPGADPAQLHLQFAEADLADARQGVHPGSSLQDASQELAAALTLLPSNHSLPLWTRYQDDRNQLAADQRELEAEGRASPEPGAVQPGSGAEPETATPGGGADASQPATAAGGAAPPESASPSAAEGGGTDHQSGGGGGDG